MVSISDGVVYYCTVFLTAIVFLTEASAIATNYEKSSTTQNKTNESPEVSPQRTKLAATRSRSNLSKNHDRVSPLSLSNKLKTSTRLESIAQTNNKTERELLLVSNSGGENDIKDKGGGGNTEDDDQKTLSQQVADGKYGLIQHEIFTTKPARPGVISYDVNPEVPKDNINNLGGLEPDDIWLAENHLLVLAGSGLGSMQHQWTPIDNYVAPQRQVQIPPNPKVPPPFPVQLNENGPIEYLKSDSHPILPQSPYFNPLLMQYVNISNGVYGKMPTGSLTNPVYSPYKPALPGNFNQRPLPPPVYIKPPPGADFLPPYLTNINASDSIDEDDPSLYYPPPYDFYYPKDNTTKVPPGPLVPGIVLPPPPDFFMLWTNTNASKEVSKLTVVKDKFKPNNVQKTGKQLHYPASALINNKPDGWRPQEPTTKYITFNEIINEVTYPDTQDNKITYADVKVNKVSTEDLNEDWIPIPAPKPFYITGEKKPSKNTVLVVMEPPESFGYNYEKPVTTLRVAQKRPLLKYLQYIDQPKDLYATTTPISPQLSSTKLPKQDNIYSTTPLPFYQPPNTIKATYYFYEEPQFNDGTGNKIKPSSFDTVTPSLSVRPAIDFNNYPLPKPVVSTYRQPSKLKEHDTKQEKKRKPIVPMIPIYYLAEVDNLVNLVKPMSLPYITTTKPTPKAEYYTTTMKPTYTIDKPNYERPTPKPIIEYSYIASDYNAPAAPPSPIATEAPLIPYEISQHSTPSSAINYENRPKYSIDYSILPYQSPQQYNPDIYSPLTGSQHFSKPVQTTANPILLLNHYAPSPQNTPSYSNSFDRPWLSNLNIYNPFTYTTENPYYAFFTKEEEDLIDENTKKYFTIFGQKIKSNLEAATSPLPAKVSPSPTPTTIGHKWNSNKYGFSSSSSSTNPIYPSQSSSSNYYSSTTPYSADYTSVKSQRRLPPSPSSSTTSAYVSSTPATPPLQYFHSSSSNKGSSSSSTDKPLSLEGDTLVNYVTPLPDENPDAEYVSPKISKHIRPIVVEDLPSDLNERLKNLANLQKSKNTVQQNGSGTKTRYVLIDDEYQDRRLYPPQNTLDKGRKGGFDRKYSLRGPFAEQQSYLPHHQRGPGDSSTPLSLESDTRVNYRTLLRKDPDAEYVSTSAEYHRSNHRPDKRDELTNEDEEEETGADVPIRKGGHNAGKKSQNTKPISLQNDILVNYKNAEHYTTDADAEYVDKSPRPRKGGHIPSYGGSSQRGSGSTNVISFRYPDIDHSHFYFLTPQEAHLTQIEDERYDYQSNVEKPSSYFKRKPREFYESTTPKMAEKTH